ncbi:MAG: sulfotransferase [Candidatus Binatia bacterium]
MGRVAGVSPREVSMSGPLVGSNRGFVESADGLHDAARKAVSCDDFGDPAYLEGFRVLTEAYDRESRLTPAGRAMVETQLLGILENRLATQKAWTENPAILRNEIRQPIFVLGLARTGTTALHHLLSQDPNLQVLEYWLAAAPSPRPPRTQWEADPRYQRAVQELDWTYKRDPSLRAMHLMTADGPDECRHLFQQNLTDDTFDCNATIPSYSDWYGRQDMLATYGRHRDLLKLIGSTSPERRWLLKYPVHMGNLHALFATYPDACIVQTHRDPCRVIPSICSLVTGWRGLYEEGVDRAAVARWLIELWATRLERGLAVRRGRDSRSFFDLHFREILADPVGTVKRIYDHFGIEMTHAATARFQAWVGENPRGKYGAHRYRAEDFGLAEDMIADRFGTYMKHFQIERERAA